MRTECRVNSWLKASLSFCPKCLALAAVSLFTSVTANLCHPPSVSATIGRNPIPSLRQSSAAPSIFLPYLYSRAKPGLVARSSHFKSHGTDIWKVEHLIVFYSLISLRILLYPYTVWSSWAQNPIPNDKCYLKIKYEPILTEYGKVGWFWAKLLRCESKQSMVSQFQPGSSLHYVLISERYMWLEIKVDQANIN